MAAKELFNQPLKYTFGTTDRLPLGVPGMDGCDNMLMSTFIDLLKNTGVLYGSFNNGNLTAYVWEFEHGKETNAVELTLYDNNGVKQSIDSMMSIIDVNTIQVDFGGDINGTWTYIFKYWNI
jgi:hypothetical protein